ncbi:unnamed protein product [Cyclocybe aegerita]|uniref:Protein-S-isoprenylcysteine O-methyltransferase n=1 Tax=Cyclocybe aegerita TaxID=1973307 RepID=A0A8S0WYW1_CYCAE|nr:unnamed protein product [Cyclocybe aegerita]
MAGRTSFLAASSIRRKPDMKLLILKADSPSWSSARVAPDESKASPFFDKITHLRLGLVGHYSTHLDIAHFKRLTHVAIPYQGPQGGQLNDTLRIFDLPATMFLVIVLLTDLLTVNHYQEALVWLAKTRITNSKVYAIPSRTDRLQREWEEETTLTPPQAPAETQKHVGAIGLEVTKIPRFIKMCFWVTGTLKGIVLITSAYPTHFLLAYILRNLVHFPQHEMHTSGPFLAAWITSLSTTLIRRRCYHVLGRMFTFELTIRKNHWLITSGLYAYVRHSSYSSGALALFAALEDAEDKVIRVKDEPEQGVIILDNDTDTDLSSPGSTKREDSPKVEIVSAFLKPDPDDEVIILDSPKRPVKKQRLVMEIVLPTMVQLIAQRKKEAVKVDKKMIKGMKLTRGKKIKKVENMQFSLDTVNNRLKLVNAVVPYEVTLDKEIQEFTVSQDFMSSVYGGSMQATRPKISDTCFRAHGYNMFAYLHEEYHPHAPRFAGGPGLFLGTEGGEDWGGSQRVFTRILPNIWQYMGQYQVKSTESLKPEEWK